tara:strand:- start:587 stop:769 length:183 start_codon:yes stop_codon:yes gene_type:complete
MSEKTMNAALFGGCAALVACLLAFVVLKAFKVKSPFEHKIFPYMLGGFMLIAYVARAAIL